MNPDPAVRRLVKGLRHEFRCLQGIAVIKKIQDAALLEQIGGGWGIAPPSPTQYSGMSAEEIRRIMEWLQKQQQL